MKTIKKVALKAATKLSQEEMKSVFGGSGLTPAELVDRTCKVGTRCRVVVVSGAGSGSDVVYTGTCQGTYASGNVSCYCEVVDFPYTSINLSHCFRGN